MSAKALLQRLKAEKQQARQSPPEVAAPPAVSTDTKDVWDELPSVAPKQVGELATIKYADGYLTEAQEAAILAAVYRPAAEWVDLRRRRLQMLGGTPLASGWTPEPIVPGLQAVCEWLNRAGVFPPEYPANHILVNEYSPGQGIFPHKDGPLYHSLVAIVSLQSTVALEFWDEPNIDSDSVCKVLCRPRSLLLFTDDAYTAYWHGIRSIKEDYLSPLCVNIDASLFGHVSERTHTRISLTIRHALRAVATTQAAT